jgi:hypothetical protein
MADTLEIFGTEYTNVAGIIAKDDNGVDQTYTKGGGHLTQDQDGFLVIPPDGSGGGSSDFSTANVTVVRNTTAIVALPVKYDDGSIGAIVVDNANSGDNDIFLYKGHAFASVFTAGVNVSASGNATAVEGGVEITGDCTITIS